MRYRGLWDAESGRALIVLDGEGVTLLPIRMDVWHFASCMTWGKGPADSNNQLALAMLLHATGEQNLSLECAELFARYVIDKLDRGGFELSQVEVMKFTVRFVAHWFVAPTEIQLTGKEVADAGDPPF